MRVFVRSDLGNGIQEEGGVNEQRAAKREGYAKDRTTFVGLVFPTGPAAIATILV